MCHDPCADPGLAERRDGASIIRFPRAGRPYPAVHNPDLDPEVQLRRYGHLLEWVKLWLNRSRMRRDLMDLALRQPDSVLDGAGMTRKAALREASKWFWMPPEL